MWLLLQDFVNSLVVALEILESIHFFKNCPSVYILNLEDW